MHKVYTEEQDKFIKELYKKYHSSDEIYSLYKKRYPKVKSKSALLCHANKIMNLKIDNRNEYTTEQNNYLKKLCNECTSWGNVYVMFKKRFKNYDKSKRELEHHAYIVLNLKLKNIKIKPTKYTKQENDYLIEQSNKCCSANELIISYQEKFNDGRTYEQIHNHLKHQLKITYKKFKFEKGNTLNEFIPVGTERIKDGYVIIKFSDSKPKDTVKDRKVYAHNWELKSKYLYEQKFGKIPEGYHVVFIDNNKMNLDINNLVLLPDELIIRLQKYERYHDGDVEFTKSIIKLYQLDSLLRHGKYLPTSLEKEISVESNRKD